jgi:hypothetical protein
MSVLTTLMVLGAVVLGPELQHCRLGEPVFKNEALGFIPDARLRAVRHGRPRPRAGEVVESVLSLR